MTQLALLSVVRSETFNSTRARCLYDWTVLLHDFAINDTSTELRTERIHRYEVDTEYKLRVRTRVVSEERRRNRAPGFLRGPAPTGCAPDTVQTRHAPERLYGYTNTPTIFACVRTPSSL